MTCQLNPRHPAWHRWENQIRKLLTATPEGRRFLFMDIQRAVCVTVIWVFVYRLWTLRRLRNTTFGRLNS